MSSSDLRAAAQQALEAMEKNTKHLPLHFDNYFEAMHTLRAALAEPVQEPEPAGWFEGPFGEFRANPLHRIAWPAQTVAWSIPLYLAPPQRRPLTDEEIYAAIKNVDSLRAVEVARAIERAHGIGKA